MRLTGGLVFLGIGLLLLAIALGVFLYGSWYRLQAEKVDGVVIDVPLTQLPDGNAYCPVIQYSVIGGGTYTHYSNVCSWPPSYKVGQHVVMYVDRSNPERVQIGEFFSTWFIPLLFGFLGVVFGGVGLWTQMSQAG